MRLLWIATKPPAPPLDGGRLVAILTIEALAREGVEITVVAPVAPGSNTAEAEAALKGICRPRLVPATTRHPLRSALASFLGGRPYSIARHALSEVRDEVARLLAAETFDAVHAEQLQAFAQAEPALSAGVPVVLRAQNVESDLWQATARLHPWAGPCLAREARRLARYEGEAVRRASATVALTERDAARLRELAGADAEVVAIPPPFPSELPAADHELAGEPPLVLLGSGGWLPNREGTRWFLEEVWPEMRSRVPGAVLHLYASPAERPKDLPAGVEPHPPPADSRDAFAPNAVLVVPVRIASGIRMKILEAWARGVPVVATPEAAAGLWVENDTVLGIASTTRELAERVTVLARSPGAIRSRGTLAEAHRQALLPHDPPPIAEALKALYRLGQ